MEEYSGRRWESAAERIGHLHTGPGLLTGLLTNFVPKLDRQKETELSKLIFSKAFYSSQCLEEALAVSGKSNLDSKESLSCPVISGPTLPG